jgi:tRNA 2-selenouridine synthase
MNFSDFDAVIDARTPAEFAEDHIPGAISAPVLYDVERAEVGTLYKQVSAFEAKKVGAELVARNVARHIKILFSDKPETWRPLVYCWRGGKRSGAMAHILREIGWEAETLPGGYKAYRKWVVQQLEILPQQFDFQVVHGPTGSGKSRLLAALARAGAQILDLEALAAHRGSVLGGLPDRPQPSQKMFESQLLNALSALDKARLVYVEGERRKIRPAALTRGADQRMRASLLRIETDTETRVTLLLDEYRHFLGPSSERNSTASQPAWAGADLRLEGARHSGAWREFVARLLAEHYDPAYRRSSHKNFVRLPDARVVRIAAADEAAFSRAAQLLLASAELQPA